MTANLLPTLPYIAIEGIKGVGKSTVLSLLQQRLQRLPHVSINPTSRISQFSWMEFLDQHLPLRRFDCWTRALYANRSNGQVYQAQEQASALLEEGIHPQFILGDRSILTSITTRWNQGKENPEEYYNTIRQEERLIPIPKHVLYMHASMETICSRISARKRDYGASDEQPKRLMAAHETYMKLKDGVLRPLKNIKWHMISAESRPEQVCEDLYKTIVSILSEKKTQNKNSTLTALSSALVPTHESLFMEPKKI